MNRVIFGDCRDTMRAWAAAGVKAQMCVTSPPYFGLRDYGHDGQIGLEQTPEAYIAAMVETVRTTPYQWPLGAKLALVSLPFLLLGLLTTALTLWVSWQLDGGAAAVNEAGRMRMQTYRMAWLAGRGDRAALDRIYASLYPDLKRLAHARLRDQGRGEAMNTTTLVHESFMRLVASRGLSLDDRRHFFAYAATTMRHIIIDSARAVQTERRGSGAAHVTLADDEAQSVADERSCRELLRVHEALLALEALDPDLSQIVEMRYFGGYSEPEMAETVGVCGIKAIDASAEPAKETVSDLLQPQRC